jgi:hypothetical protein
VPPLPTSSLTEGPGGGALATTVALAPTGGGGGGRLAAGGGLALELAIIVPPPMAAIPGWGEGDSKLTLGSAIGRSTVEGGCKTTAFSRARLTSGIRPDTARTRAKAVRLGLGAGYSEPAPRGADCLVRDRHSGPCRPAERCSRGFPFTPSAHGGPLRVPFHGPRSSVRGLGAKSGPRAAEASARTRLSPVQRRSPHRCRAR